MTRTEFPDSCGLSRSVLRELLTECVGLSILPLLARSLVLPIVLSISSYALLSVVHKRWPTRYEVYPASFCVSRVYGMHWFVAFPHLFCLAGRGLLVSKYFLSYSFYALAVAATWWDGYVTSGLVYTAPADCPPVPSHVLPGCFKHA